MDRPSKVTNLSRSLMDEDVLWLDISMDDIIPMHIFNSIADFFEVSTSNFLLDWLFLYRSVEISV